MGEATSMVPRDDMLEHVSAVTSEKRKKEAMEMTEDNILMRGKITRR